jgi:formylglycine-generating enzyme required for sulfatase activity
MTWFQATSAARNSGKRLLTNAEWQTAALGTPDTGLVIGAEDCNTFGFGGPDLTGARSNCISSVGITDMVGNVAEWVADWIVSSGSNACGWGTFSDDTMCLGGYPTLTGPFALVRGGGFNEGAGGRDAGPFASGLATPSAASAFIGFRAGR